MESENQHVYGALMDSVPCAWSRNGASAMARIRSRRHSDRALPRPTREGSLTSKWPAAAKNAFWLLSKGRVPLVWQSLSEADTCRRARRTFKACRPM